MKQLLFLLLLIPVMAAGQIPAGYTKFNVSYDWIRGKFDSTLTIPFGASPSIKGGYNHSGNLFYRTTDSSVYVYTGYQWIKLGAGGTDGDTTYLVLPLYNLNDSTIAIHYATATDSGYLRAVDWVTFNSKVTSVAGTTNRVTSTGGATPVIDISAAYVGQTSITTLGTVTTGTLGTGSIIGRPIMTLGSDATADMYHRNSSGILTRIPTGTTKQTLHPDGSGGYVWKDTATFSGAGFVGDTIVGSVVNSPFTAGSIPSNWTNSGATLSFTGNGMTSATVGYSFYGAYVKGKDTTASLNSIVTVEFVLNTKPAADTQGICLGRFSTNASQMFDYAVWLKRVIGSTTTWKGYLYLIANHTDIQLVDSTNGALSMVNGQKYRLIFNISNGYAVARFSVVDSTKSGFSDEAEMPVMFNYRYRYEASSSKLIPNTGVGWIVFRGGSYRVTKYSEISGDLTRADYAILTTSIGTRYSVYNVSNGWPAKLFEETGLRYALFGGGGDKLDDFISRWQQVKATHPRYVIIDGAPNDANFGDVRQYGVRLIDSITSIGAIPIWLQITSNSDRDTTIQNICREKNILWIPAYLGLTPAMYIDLTVHPNATGDEVIANKCRPLLTNAGYFTNARSVGSDNMTDAVDHITLGRTDGWVPSYSTTDLKYHDIDLATFNDTRYIKNNGTGTAQTSASADVDGYLIGRTGMMTGGYLANGYLFNFIKNAAGSQQGFLITNSNSAGGDYAGAEFGVGGSGASNGWASAFYLLGYGNGGINLTAPVGSIHFNVGSYGTEKYTFTSSGFGIGATSPNSSLQIVGSFASTYVAKTGTYTITGADYTIDCTSNTFTVTLPTAVSITGRMYVIKNSGAGTITIATTSSQTIDGAATKSLSVQYGGYTVMSDGANWKIISSF